MADDVRKVFTEEGRGVLQACVTPRNGGLAAEVRFFLLLYCRFAIARAPIQREIPWGCAQSLNVLHP